MLHNVNQYPLILINGQDQDVLNVLNSNSKFKVFYNFQINVNVINYLLINSVNRYPIVSGQVYIVNLIYVQISLIKHLVHLILIVIGLIINAKHSNNVMYYKEHLNQNV